MVHGSWPNAHGSCLKALGSRLMAHGQEKFDAGSPRPGPWRQIFLGHETWSLSHEPWGMSHEPWAMSHEPLTINDRLSNYSSIPSFLPNIKITRVYLPWWDRKQRLQVKCPRRGSLIDQKSKRTFWRYACFEAIPTQISFIRSVGLNQKIIGVFCSPL